MNTPPPHKQARLIDGPIGRTLVNLTFPMMGGIMAMIAFNLVDTYFIAQLGTQSLAAISFTFPVVMALMHLALGVGIGTSSVVARAIGEGDQIKVRRVTTDGILLAVCIVAFFSGLGLLTIHPVFKALGASEETIVIISEYMKVWYLGMGFVVIPMTANSAIRATGNAVFPGLIMVGSALINLILDPLLIFGWGGFPALGIRGAAIATVIAWGFSFLACLWVLYYYEKLLTFVRPSLKEVLQSWKEIVKVGIPAATTNMIIPLAFGIIVSLLSNYGEEVVAAFGVATRLEAFSLVVLLALSSIIGPFVGQNWGAKKYERVHLGLRLCFRFCLLFGAALAFIFQLFAVPLVTIFDSNPVVISVATLYLLINPVSYGPHGIIMIANASFNSLGHPFPSLTISIIRMFGIYVPLAFLANIHFGIIGIFCAYGISNILVSCVAYVWNRNLLKRKIIMETA